MNIQAPQFSGLRMRQFIELDGYDVGNKVMALFAGIVLKVSNDNNINSFIVSDGTATAEVSLIYYAVPPSEYLPKQGESVKLIGVGYKKILGSGNNTYSFLKILCSGIGTISPEQEIQLSIEAVQNRSTNQRQQPIKFDLQRPLAGVSSLSSPQQKIELRSLIMTYCYYIFEHNTDIQSYLFNAQMVRCSKDGMKFLNQNRSCKKSFDEALLQILQEMDTAGFISKKATTSNQKELFIIKRQLFKGIESTVQERVMKTQKQGVNIDKVNDYVNRSLSKFSNRNFTIVDLKFTQKVLIKLQSLNRIFKTSDKLIFPNMRS